MLGEETGSSHSGACCAQYVSRETRAECDTVNRSKLEECEDVEEVEALVRKMGKRWMGYKEQDGAMTEQVADHWTDAASGDIFEPLDGLGLLE